MGDRIKKHISIPNVGPINLRNGLSVEDIIDLPDFTRYNCLLGFFYVVLLIPDIYCRRIKFGFTKMVKNRISSIRTITPTAEIIGVWECTCFEEKEIIEKVVNKLKGRRVGKERPKEKPRFHEVFDFEDPDSVVRYVKDEFENNKKI